MARAALTKADCRCRSVCAGCAATALLQRPLLLGRVTLAAGTSAPGVLAEADLDVLDEHGTVLLTVRGLQLATTVSENESRNRVLNERLLTIEWQQRELPEEDHVHAGAWLLISTSDAAQLLATGLTDALKLHGAECTTMFWPQHGDHGAAARVLRGQLGEGGFAGVVVVTGPKNGNPDEECALRGGEYTAHVVRIARELSEIADETPRLYVVTRGAQAVLDGDRVNLEQGGLRGLLRVIGAEHPHLWVAHIDIDEQTGTEQVVGQLLAGSDEDETAWRSDEWYAARLSPTVLRPDEGRITEVDHSRDGMRLRLRIPGDLQTTEFVAFDRAAPGPGQIEVAVTASSINFADVLAAFGQYPSFGGQQPQPGTDFAGVVTAVGPDVTDHKVGDRVGGMSPNGCWATFVTCDARLAATLPQGLTDAQAAAVTTAAATAWYGLNDLARIKAGDRVLIHSGTGGVGQAAIGSRAPREPRSSPPPVASSAENCCAPWVSTMSTTREALSSPSRSGATPTGTAWTSCSTPRPVPRNRPAWGYSPSVDASSRSASATSTATRGWGFSRSGATSRSLMWIWR